MIRFNLKMLRLINENMTQRELIIRSGIRADTLSKLENNRAKTISIEQIDKLCEVFDCQPSELMTYSKSKNE